MPRTNILSVEAISCENFTSAIPTAKQLGKTNYC